MNVRNVLPRDAIPSVDDPTYEPVTDYDGDPDDEVVVVDGEPARAYPVRYLHYHEIVNATDSGGRPVAVTWCPLCGSAVVYERTVAAGDGDETRTLTFGVSGKLADDDLVMYDRETDSEWKQSRGVAIDGPLSGTQLTVVPAAMTTVERFRDANPDGELLAPPGGESEAASDTDDPEPIDYDAAPYERYFEMDGFGLAAHRGTGDGRDWDRDDGIDPKTVVLGLTVADDALGFPLPRVEANGSVAQTTVGDRDVVVFATPDGIHAFENPGFVFERTVEPGTFVADGTRWDGATGEGDDGRSLERLPSRRLFAFAWQDDHGADAFYENE
ncbi:DUF3179 domain-containing protein [Haloarchaeobius litoreus]|uniref:DUF3179 domain-containing protein n=1 Tax=Haloarchaeobius litoreus TaxID=755306 RepID=A0ABD6DHP7_9EURY